ncbi:LacI family DNA-binding transcriptional regulator [Saccharothrix deserti]|uniref:LacI family DNA-binding transcriptional regulator n=1 Tax=Saccharothrix deserti TaxID=2593674 RepID=UPI002368A69C|nr:substrate-binding domain-containing protein [Saccharothrix deserti]
MRCDFDRDAAYGTVRRLLASGLRFTAIVAVTDMCASGALVALRHEGVRVPEDVSVAGHDDIPLATVVHPALTTVHIPHEELGRTAVRLALNRERHAMSQHTVLGTHLVIRESTGPAKTP